MCKNGGDKNGDKNVGTKMCKNVLFRWDFMPTLVENANVYSRLLFTKKKSTREGGPGSLGPLSDYAPVFANGNFTFQMQNLLLKKII